MVANTGTFSRLSASPSANEWVQDNTDSIHSGIAKALALMGQGSYLASGCTTTENAGTPAYLSIGDGGIFRNNEYIPITGSTASTDAATNADYPASHASINYYCLLVLADGTESGETANRLYLRGSASLVSSASSPVVAEPLGGDVILAMVEIVAATATSAVSRKIQWLGVNTLSNNLSIAYNNSGAYTETMSIIGSAARTTFKNKIADADIRFILADNTADEKFEILTDDDSDGDEGDTTILSIDGAGTLTLNNGATIVNTDANTLTITEATTSIVGGLAVGSAGELTITESSDDITIKNTVSDKDIIFNINDGGSDTEVMRIRGSNACVGIGTNAPTEMLHLTDADGSEPTILIENTGTAGNEPEIVFWRSTGTGADSRDIGHIRFKADDTAGNLHTFAQIYVDSHDADSGTEDGRIIFDVSQAGTDGVEHLRIQGGSVIINDASANIDFRVEGDTQTHLLFTDGGNDRIGINQSSPLALLSTKGNLDSAISGTVTTTDASERITGSGSSFLSQLRAGQAIKVGSETRIIHSITSDTVADVDATTPFTSGGSGVVSGGNAYIDDVLLLMEDGNGTDVLGVRNNSIIALESGIINSVRLINSPTDGTASTLYATDRHIIVDLAAIPLVGDYNFTLNGDNSDDIGRIFTIQCVAIGGGGPMAGTGVDIVLAGSDILFDVDNSNIANSSTQLQLVAGKSYTILQQARNIFRVIHKTV